MAGEEEVFRDVIDRQGAGAFANRTGCETRPGATKETGRVFFFEDCGGSTTPIKARRTVGCTQKIFESLRDFAGGGAEDNRDDGCEGVRHGGGRDSDLTTTGSAGTDIR